MNTFNLLHKYYDKCYTNDIFDRDKLLNRFKKDKSILYSGETKIDILQKLYDAVLNAKFLNDFSLEYLKNSSLSVKSCVEQYNLNIENENELLTEFAGRSKVIYCTTKVNDIFKNIRYDRSNYNIVSYIFDKPQAFSESGYTDLDNAFLSQLDCFIDKYITQRVKIYKGDILIKLPDKPKVIELTDEEFFDFLDIIRPYSKNQLKTIENALESMDKEVGYFKYLIEQGNSLSSVDKERLDTILRWLGKKSTDTIDSDDNIDNTEDDDIII